MSDSSPIPEESWISAFCALVGHEYFAEVSEDFIEDDFNLTGLQSQVPMYKEALEMILDVEPEDDDISDEEEEEEDDDDASDLGSDASMRDDAGANGYNRGGGGVNKRHARMQSDLSVIESSAEVLYGLIHQRFITSRQGIQQMLEKYECGHFGQCPRVHCRGAKVLPVGCSDIPGQETVKLFCPACLDVYAPPNSRFQGVDGAFFGTTFGCLFFMTFPELEVGGSKLAENGVGHVPSTSSLGDGASSLDGKNASPAQNHGTKQEHLAPQPGSINGVATGNLAPGLGHRSLYEPKIYGFRVSELAKSGPRMKWLRQKPEKVTELDEVELWENMQKKLYSEKDEGEEGAEGNEDIDEDVEAQDEEEEEDVESEGEEEAAGGVTKAVVDTAGRGKKSRHRGTNGSGGGGTAIRS